VRALLDALSWSLAGLTLLIVLTGGTTLGAPPGRIDLTYPLPWVAMIGALALLGARFARSPGSLWESSVRALRRLVIEEPERGERWAIRGLVLFVVSLFLTHVLRHLAIHTDIAELSLFGSKPFPAHLVFAIRSLIVGVPLLFLLIRGPLRHKRGWWLPAVAIAFCLPQLRDAVGGGFGRGSLEERALSWFGSFVATAFFMRKAQAWWIPFLGGVVLDLYSGAGPLPGAAFLVYGTWLGLARYAETWDVRGTRASTELLAALLVALALSGTWPGRTLQKNWPRWDSVRDAAFLQGVEIGRTVGASSTTLAQLANQPSFRLIYARNPPDDDPAKAWKAFLEGSSLQGSEALILDLHHAGERKLAEAVMQQMTEVPWRVLKTSPSRRFMLVEKQ
jgi:hypothetical protein